MLYIGIDLGTSTVKLLMMKETGEIQKIVSREYLRISRSWAGGGSLR